MRASRASFGAIAPIALALAMFVVPGAVNAACSNTPTLDGSCNNVANPTWGQTNTPYLRVGSANYADGIGSMVIGPNARYVSNRIMNDVADHTTPGVGQNLFSERNVSAWVWLWGQFMDHTFGLAQGGSEQANIVFDPTDPLEAFHSDIPCGDVTCISFKRNAPAPGTGTSASNPRQQKNTVSSYIDGFSVYGGTDQRLDWLRAGACDGTTENNSPMMLTAAGVRADGSYLPRTTARTPTEFCPTPNMAMDGRLLLGTEIPAVAGDVRANENMALTGVHTLFVREHNRIVGLLNNNAVAQLQHLSDEQKFQIARSIVRAEQQFITYNEFLPAAGVTLPAYSGYKTGVNASLGNEFAAVAYRAHSMIHGDLEMRGAKSLYTQTQLDQMRAMGITFEDSNPGQYLITVPLNAGFFNPDLVPLIGLGPILSTLGDEPQYKNDEQIANELRSVLFQVPAGNPPNLACFTDPSATDCFHGVVDLGAIDAQRGRDHGILPYNQMRRLFGLAPVTSFTAITGESTEDLQGLSIDDPTILDFTALFDKKSKPLPLGSDEGAVGGTRRTTLAARLKAIYGSVDNPLFDPFVGMISEKHVSGSEFGPLQRAVWTQQFQALRDGDRFYYQNDQTLANNLATYNPTGDPNGITYRHTLSELIRLNTGNSPPANVFFARG